MKVKRTRTLALVLLLCIFMTLGLTACSAGEASAGGGAVDKIQRQELEEATGLGTTRVPAPARWPARSTPTSPRPTSWSGQASPSTPFEMAVKEGDAAGIMGSMNRIGFRKTVGSYVLMTQLLREEWGFHGGVITDFTTYTAADADQLLAAGTNLIL